MADREKVIEGQKQVILHLHRMSEVGYDGDVPYYEDLRDKAEDALELLKGQPEIVRCSECNRRASYDCPIYHGGDGMHDEPDDWFCGDGEKAVKWDD